MMVHQNEYLIVKVHKKMNLEVSNLEALINSVSKTIRTIDYILIFNTIYYNILVKIIYYVYAIIIFMPLLSHKTKPKASNVCL